MKTLVLALAVLAAPAAAQAPNWTKAQPISITMTEHGFIPRRIAVQRNGLYVLRVTNRSGKGHNLTQKAFFANARIAQQDRGWVRDGQIVLDSGRRATVHLQAPATRRGGTYEFSSTTLADADDDYKGVFVIR
jgi:hypothetical protein